MTKARWFDTLGLVAWALLVAALTLTPTTAYTGRFGHYCLLCGDVGGADLVRNVLLFAPAGLFLTRRGFSLLIATGIGFLISGAIEGAQLFFVAGRHASVRDVLVNGFGAGFGAAFYRTMEYGVKSGSRALLAAAVAFAVGGVALTGALMQRVSTDGVYFAQWLPKRPYYARWDGELIAAAVDQLPTRIGRLRNTDAIRSALEADRPVSLTFRRGNATASLTAIYVLMDDTQREILMIGADGDDLVVRPRLRAREWYLDTSDQRFPGFFAADAAQDTLQIAVTTDRQGRTCVEREARSSCTAPTSLGAGWQLVLYKGSLPAWLKRALHGGTLFLLLMPLSIVSRAQSRRRAVTVTAGTVVAMLLAGLPFGIGMPGIAELLGVTAALLVATVQLRR